ncbi:endonuclease/exonuclease/phosphatase family protein [Psychroflexus planctonicus]|uniref:Endonuclease n=1 Tax=Psychroflexus planctonicus TaxID=1526575 RepID=A0ABQ1SE33_9FLAO|nr:endonuclease/exonuclease/phosphatase family protein [Psychroflexus planctonicus]GGE29764.1 endonuclease [Psychroflexus planctonicus]
MNIVLIILEFAFFVMAFITLLNINHWSVRVLDFPKVQLLVLSLLVATASIGLENYQSTLSIIAFIFILAAIVFHLVRIIPYTKFYPKEVQTNSEKDHKNRFNVMSFNVLMDNTKYQYVLHLIQEYNPDVLLLLETNATWENAMKDLESNYTYCIKIPQENLYGMHLYSKFPLHDTQVRYVVKKQIPSIKAKIELPSGQKIQVYAMHPKPPNPSEAGHSTNRDAELLIIGKEAKKSKLPVIVFGDLNDVAWSRSTRLFKKVSGLLDPRIGRGNYNTFHADYSFLRWPLDHLFHSHHFMLNEIKVLPHAGSDHFPIFVSLQFNTQNKIVQDPVESDTEDETQAKEKIEDAFGD